MKELTPEEKEAYIETAKTLKGSDRRVFMARIVKSLGKGRQSYAERELSWYRSTIRKGMRELKSAVRIVDNFKARGRKSVEYHFYGTDWLAFGHVVIALAFIGPLRDPWRNRWVAEWGILACVLVIPWALVFGPLRGIPFFWRLIDASFGFGGLALLLPAYRLIRKAASDYGLRVTG